MSATAGQPMGWVLNGKRQEVDLMAELAIDALENLERVLQKAVEAGRFDVLHKSIKTFSALTLYMVKHASQEYAEQHPGDIDD